MNKSICSFFGMKVNRSVLRMFALLEMTSPGDSLRYWVVGCFYVQQCFYVAFLIAILFFNL